MLWVWMMSFGLPFPLLALRAEKRYRALPALSPDSPQADALPALSVIVPARNEEANLPVLLPSLINQDYSGDIEIIIVDDHSSDGTAEIAAAAGVRVLPAPVLPPGWYGKPNACHAGAFHAKGEWLLFLDADTRLYPGCLAAAVSRAATENLDGLSLFLAEHSTGLVNRLAMMAAFAGLFAGMPSNLPVLNGQFILLTKDVYAASGGFSEVRSEAIEDLALARLLRRKNFHAPILVGTAAGEVRMYNSLRTLWSGLVRLGSGALRWSGPGSLLTALFIAGAVLPIVAVPLTLFAGMPAAWLAVIWASVTICFSPWALRSGSIFYAPLAPFGALIVQLAAVTGLLRSLAGLGVPWKGRILQKRTP